jgi:nucleoid-associated protein YgaU
LAHVQSLGLPLKTLTICLKADYSVEISGEVTQQTDAEKIALTVGNVEGVESVNNNMTVVAPAPDSHYHAMVLGDWLSKIAKTYYDHANKYNVIFDANKPMLQDPDEIYLGQVLRIPNL